MEGGKKFLTFLLVAVLAFGCGFGGSLIAGGYYKSTAVNTVNTGNVSGKTDNTTNTVQDPAIGTQDPAIGLPEQDKTGQEPKNNTAQNTGETIVINPPDISSLGEAIADKVLPSVVGIDTIYETSYSSSLWYFGFGDRGGKVEAEAQGTGFIVDEAGYILTNSHVINDGNYKSVTITLYGGQEVEGKVLWNDPTLDLAIVKIEADNLTAAELGDSDSIKIGSYAAALGNPLGLQFKFSMSQGIISGLERTIEVSSGSGSSKTTTMEDLLQTDAAINSGNSGGPLVNNKGQVIGINSAKASDGESMGFAIPINTAKPIVEQIKATGSFTRAYLGITGGGLEETGYDSATLKERYGAAKGIYVNSVMAGGGAEAAGITKGDIIIMVEGVEVGTMNKINSILVGYKIGDSVKVTYLREDRTYEVDVVLTGSIN